MKTEMKIVIANICTRDFHVTQQVDDPEVPLSLNYKFDLNPCECLNINAFII